MTCADDVWVKLFVPKVEVRRVSAALSPPLDSPRLTRRRRQGFWTDLDGYYSSPPQLLSVDQLAGPREDLAQLFRILIALAYVSFLLVICRGRPMLRPLVLTAARSPSAATTRNAPSPSPPTPSSPTSTSRPRHLSEPPTRRSRCRNSPHQASTRRSTSPSSSPPTSSTQRAGSSAKASSTRTSGVQTAGGRAFRGTSASAGWTWR